MFLSILKHIVNLRFFRRGKEPQNNWQVIAWWEVRRIPYNLLVGLSGLVSCVLFIVTSLVTEKYLGEPVGLPDPPIFAVIFIVIYGIAANICYTFGWVVELFVEKVWPGECKSFGPISFTLGMIFSILLTLVPGVLIVILGIICLLK